MPQVPLKIELKLQGGVGSVIPKNITETLLIQIVDNYASYKFKDHRTTRAFAQRQNQDGVETKYSDRLQKAISHYPNMSQKQIAEHISRRLKELSK